MKTDIIQKCIGFDWDEGNISKNWDNHKVAPSESEQIFFNRPLIVAEDQKHSQLEERFFALGITDARKYLFTAFTIRKNCIRIISSRDMSKKERSIYEKQRDQKDS